MTPIEEIKWLIEEAQTLVEDNHARSAEYVLAEHGPKLLALVEAVGEMYAQNVRIKEDGCLKPGELMANTKRIFNALAALKEDGDANEVQ